MAPMSKTREWLKEVTDGASLRSVADRIGEYNVTFTRRINAGDAQTITAVAREYGVNPIPGLIAADIISKSDLDDYVHEVGIDAYDDLELAEKVVERIAARQDSPLATVTEFPSPPESTNAADQEQGTDDNTTPPVRTEGYDPLADVAYSGPDEDAQRRQEDGDFD